jgi:hypothetical protein
MMLEVAKGLIFRVKMSESTIDRVPLRLAGDRDRVAAAGGEMLGAVFGFLGELVSQDRPQPPPEAVVSQVRSRLAECVQDDPSGRPRLTVTLPDRRALDTLAQTLARLLGVGGSDL